MLINALRDTPEGKKLISSLSKILNNRNTDIKKESKKLKSKKIQLNLDKLLKYIRILSLLPEIMNKYKERMNKQWIPQYKENDKIVFVGSHDNEFSIYTIEIIDKNEKRYWVRKYNNDKMPQNGIDIDLNSYLENDTEFITKNEVFEEENIIIAKLIIEIQELIDNEKKDININEIERQKNNNFINEIVDMLFVSELTNSLSGNRVNIQKGGDVRMPVKNIESPLEKNTDKNENMIDDILQLLMVNILSKDESTNIYESFYDKIISSVIIVLNSVKYDEKIKNMILEFFRERFTKYNYNEDEDEVIKLLENILSYMEIVIQDKNETNILGEQQQEQEQEQEQEKEENTKKEENTGIISLFKPPDANKPIDADVCAGKADKNKILIGRMDDKCLIYNTETGKTEEPSIN